MRLSGWERLVPSRTLRRVTGGLDKLTPSSRQAEGAALLEHLRSRSSADPARCDRVGPVGITDDEARMGAQPPLVVVVSGCGYFCKCHKSPSSERFPTAPHDPVRRRSAGSCAPIDRMLTTFELWVLSARRATPPGWLTPTPRPSGSPAHASGQKKVARSTAAAVARGSRRRC